jgi:large subunit ribosomal protein L6
MSRLAKIPILLPKGTEIEVGKNNVVIAKGPKGKATLQLHSQISVSIEESKAKINPKENVSKAMLGLNWALLKNLIIGVSEGFEKKLRMIGVGYRSSIQGNKLDLKVGYSHPTIVDIPDEIEVKIAEKGTQIIVSGLDKQKVGQFAAEVRAIRKPEPYKGKGIRYIDEFVRKKAGKSAGKSK